MAPSIGTSRDNNFVGTSATNRPTCTDDFFRLSGNDPIDGRFVREVLMELDGGPQHSFPVHPGAGESTTAEPQTQ